MAKKGPPSYLTVYTGGRLRWSDVTVPKGLEVTDNRLEAHGFLLADGIVLEGKVVDLATKRPVAGRMRLQRVDPQPKGGYHYTAVAEVVGDSQGRGVLKKTPEGWHRLVIEADGFVSRIVGYALFDNQPRWLSYDSGLSRPAQLRGRITEHSGQPLADVEVHIRDVVSDVDGRYEPPHGYAVRTSADGRFRTDQLPVGRATIWLSKPGYCRLGLGKPIALPANDVELTMIKAARLRVTVDFAGTDRPQEYIVNVEPEDGESVGNMGRVGEDLHAK